MCGIAGIISSDTARFSQIEINKMTKALAHRGPDGESFWSNPSGNVLFGHRRLSIIDLSEAGNQAMHYHGRYTIIYNGEIYNYLEIKQQLQKKGIPFQTRSDTEVILAAYHNYGKDCLQLFDGMFSFAIWDEQEKTLFAGRDRFGEKPFFYFRDTLGEALLFASEIKALTAAGVATSIDNQRLLLYLGINDAEGTAHEGTTFYNNIKQLPPAHFLLYNLPQKKITIKEYWKLSKEHQISISETSAFERFFELFNTSIRRRLRSDVPVGTSLSGGLDSSSVAAVISEQEDQSSPRKTFSAVFPGFIKDESIYIQKVTNALKLENHAVTPGPEEFVKDFEKLLYHQEAPISSASVYLQYRVFELARTNHVKVLLDGQGSDEILGGYLKYIHWYLQELLHQNKFSDYTSEKVALIKSNIPFEWTWKNYAAAWFPKKSKEFLENRMVNTIKKNIQIHPDFLLEHFCKEKITRPRVSTLNDILYFNTVQSGLGELLRYADRNSMAHGTEVRLPFLSHELVEFIFSLPSWYKIHNGWTKWILRKTMEKRLPSEIVWRKDKIGFEPPQKSWMEHKMMRDYIHEAKKRLVSSKILNASVLNKKNQPHDAYAADNIDWRFLVAGNLVK